MIVSTSRLARQASVLVSLASAVALYAPVAVANLGFEQGDEGPQAPGWSFTAVDSAEVTGGDEPADFAVYADFGITVPPLQGARSLRLGTPKQVNESQGRGPNTATSDPFTADAGRITVSFRLFSLEHRGNDTLAFEVLDQTGVPIPGVQFEFEARDAGPPGNIALEHVTSGCGGLPACRLTIDIGKQSKRPADTGVYLLTMTLPSAAEGLPVRLRYTLTGGDNEAHGTWAYFDSANQPPTPSLRMNPGGDAENPALEGDFVVVDCLGTADTDGDRFTCDWLATGGGLDRPRTASGRVAVFWFPDDTPAASVRLTVTDTAGKSASTTQPVNLINGQPAVNAVNVEVLAGSSGTTICRFADPGIGRFGDDGVVAGEEETHSFVGTAQIVAAGEEHHPSFSSGFYELEVTSSGTCTVVDKDSGTGSDPYLVRVVQPAELPVRLGDESRSNGIGGNETFDAARPLEIDWKYLGAISDATDIDVFSIVRNGSPLPAGSEVVVSLSNLPDDYDLLVFSNGGSSEASPFFNAPFFNAPFFNAPFFNAPFFNAPFFNAQFDSVPFFNAPFFNAPFFNAPFFNAPVRKSPFFNAGNPAEPFRLAFSELPLSQVGLAAPDGSHVSTSDVSVAELGSLSLGALQSTPGVSLKAVSSEPGSQDEKVLVKVAPGETELYVVVVGTQFAYSTTRPYELTLEASSPPSQQRLLASTGFCDGEREDPGNAASPLKFERTWSAPGDLPATGARTLILTQRERFELEQRSAAAAAVAAGEYDDESAFWNTFWAKVDEYAARVGGTVVSVDGALFEDADRNPCSIASRNALAGIIRDQYILDASSASPRWRSPSLEAVVIVGGQNVIPLHAVPDETVVGNERDFTTDLWVRPGTPLSVAAAEGYNLTDAAYVDLIPTPFRGRSLYLEDVPVARLVESPSAIVGDLDAFLYGTTNHGRLAMGYDFFCDGTDDVAGLLGVDPINGPPCDTANPPWSAETLRSAFLDGGTTMCTAPGARAPLELAVVNAHMTTYAALSAAGFESGVQNPPQLPGFADTVAAAESAQCLAGTTTASIGCHSGLNVPDDWALPPELGLAFDPKRDWVEELGNLVAPRGYGLGDNTVANRGTEGIVTLLFDELAAGRNLGDALVSAKRRYVMSLRELDVHDEDSLVNLALFGPPQLTFALPQSLGPLASTRTSLTSAAETVHLKLLEGNGDGTERYLLGSSARSEPFGLVTRTDLDRGTWFELAPGGAQATYGRPLLPVTLPIEDRRVEPGETRIHGVALISRDAPVTPCPIDGSPRSCVIAARYLDLEDGDGDGAFDFNPVLPLPQHDWVVYEGAREPQTCVDVLAPTQLGVASTLDSGLEVRQSLVIGAAQFRCEQGEELPGAAGQTVGQHRLFTEIQLAALHPVGATAAERAARDRDFDPPQVLEQTVIANADDGSVTATLRASDASTGGSGISEIIALVYWDEGDTANGTGFVESYSVKPAGALSAEPFEHTFLLRNAHRQRLAFQYVDGAGNLTQKSLKGSLFRALDVSILSTLVSGSGAGPVRVKVADYCELESPRIAYRIGDGETTLFPVADPPPGITVTVEAADDPEASCDRILILEGLDLSAATSLTVEIRAVGAFGSDSAAITVCSDPDEPQVADEADILACGFATDGVDVIIDMFIAGFVTSDVQYRVLLPDLQAEFKYFQNGKTTAPSGASLEVQVVTSTVTGSHLEFRLRGLGSLGWNGSDPLNFMQATQSGQPGAPQQGFPDQTAVFTGMP